MFKGVRYVWIKLKEEFKDAYIDMKSNESKRKSQYLENAFKKVFTSKHHFRSANIIRFLNGSLTAILAIQYEYEIDSSGIDISKMLEKSIKLGFENGTLPSIGIYQHHQIGKLIFKI